MLYACFILGRLCVPVFANMSREPFSTRALVLSVMHATLPGIFMLLLIFFAFLHCWLNAFAEMLRFGDRMFYRVGPGPGTLGRWMQEGLGQAVGRMVAMPAVTLLPNQVHLPNMQ